MEFIHGDLVQIGEQLPGFDVVVLDRVVCCYPEVDPLVALSAAICRKWYALSYPRDRWYSRLDTTLRNWHRQHRGDPFRTYIHPEVKISQHLATTGFDRMFEEKTLLWQVAVYKRMNVLTK